MVRVEAMDALAAEDEVKESFNNGEFSLGLDDRTEYTRINTEYELYDI